MVANGWTELASQYHRTPINVTEQGTVLGNGGGCDVWTATDDTGVSLTGASCSNWTNGSGTSGGGTLGSYEVAGWQWSNFCGASCNFTGRLYCVQQ
jgi:hypothetical protein